MYIYVYIYSYIYTYISLTMERMKHPPRRRPHGRRGSLPHLHLSQADGEVELLLTRLLKHLA